MNVAALLIGVLALVFLIGYLGVAMPGGTNAVLSVLLGAMAATFVVALVYAAARARR